MLKRSVLMVFCALVVGPAWSASGALVGWWPFDEGTGTVASDATGNGNDATFNGDPQWGDGQLGGALEFDGSGDWLECADGGTLAIGEAVSVAAWIKVNALWIDHKIGGNQDFANGGYKMSIYTNNKVEFEIRTASNVAVLNRDVPGGLVLEMDTWYHVFGVYSQQEGYVRTYVNGVLDRDMATEEALGVSPGPLRLGCEPWNTGGNNFNGAMDDVRVYNHAVAEAEMPLIMLGGRLKELASNPEPADESEDIPRDLVLGWEPGVAAVTHDVYLGTVFEDVDGADRANPMRGLASQGQADSSFHPDGLLEFGQTYYWRVDEVNGAPDYAIFKGDIWSFTTEPFAYPVQNVIATTNGVSTDGTDPENTVNGSGLNAADEHSTSSSDMWQALPGVEPLQIQYEFDQVYKLHEMLVWNYNVQFELILGFGLKDVTVEYSVDSADWTALGDVVLAQATAKATYAANTTIDFGGVAAKYVRLTVNSGYGMMGQYGLSEVRFLYIPAHAREPLPTDGETGVDVVPVLSWRAGREAALHEVYVGTDREDLALVEITSEPEAELTGLEFGTMYYWRINEVSEAEAANSWEGNVWSFATREFAVVDDFESYTNADDGTRIFETWLDRWTNNTGATVGYLHIPFAEQSIVHSGGQSMPLTYDNSAAPFYSEAERDLDSMDWLANGADTLRLFVSGRSPAFYETAEGTIQTTGIGIDIWSTWDEFRYAYKSLTGDGSMIARVDSLDKSPSTWAKAGCHDSPEHRRRFAALVHVHDGWRRQRRLVAGTSQRRAGVGEYRCHRSRCSAVLGPDRPRRQHLHGLHLGRRPKLDAGRPPSRSGDERSSPDRTGADKPQCQPGDGRAVLERQLYGRCDRGLAGRSDRRGSAGR